MKYLSNFYVILFFGLFVFASCNDNEEMEVENEEEIITTLTYTLTSTDNEVAILTFRDLDGDGSGAADITVSNLTANTTYQGFIVLLNESETPAENISEEVAEEDDDHQFFFAVSDAELSVDYVDADGNGNPLGLATTLTTGDAGTGTLTVTLRHEPNKTADGVAGGDISNAGGETDIEVTFPITIE